MSAIPAASSIAPAWRRALPALMAVLALILALYWVTVTQMVGIWWRSETFAHAFLVLPISLWLIWRQRAYLATLTPRPQPLMVLGIAVMGLLWLLSNLAAVNTTSQFAVVSMFVLAVPTVLGTEIAGAMLFPLLFLYFSVPFGEFLLPTLMNHTADFTVFALQLSGIPVFREGNQFTIPTGNWSVVEACSGIRYLIASLMVGALFAYLNYRTPRRRILFMLVALTVPIIANWLRAYMIVMLGHLSGNRIAVGVDHIIYGWVFFGIVITIMFVIGARWTEADVPVSASSSLTLPRRPASSGSWTGGLTLLGAALVFVLPLAADMVIERHAGAQAAVPAVELPDRLVGTWTATSTGIVEWRPEFVDPSVQVSRAYAGRSGVVGVYVAYYRDQGSDRKLISSENMLVRPLNHDWNLVESGSSSVTAGGADLRVQSSTVLGRPIAGTGRRPHLTVWRIYWVDGHFVASDAGAKILGAWQRLRGHGDDSAALVLYADGEPVMAGAALEGFVQDNLGALRALLERARDGR